MTARRNMHARMLRFADIITQLRRRNGIPPRRRPPLQLRLADASPTKSRTDHENDRSHLHNRISGRLKRLSLVALRRCSSRANHTGGGAASSVNTRATPRGARLPLQLHACTLPSRLVLFSVGQGLTLLFPRETLIFWPETYAFSRARPTALSELAWIGATSRRKSWSWR